MTFDCTCFFYSFLRQRSGLLRAFFSRFGWQKHTGRLEILKRLGPVLVLVVGWGFCSLGVGHALAVPLADFSKQSHSQMALNLHPLWQFAKLQAPNAKPEEAFDAAQVWAWPEAQFAAPQAAKPFTLSQGERWVGRLRLQLPPSEQGVMLEIPMVRLDIAHLSYRYNDGPWRRAMAGDQIAMVRWPFAHRSPAFPIPTDSGELQLVLELGHQGMMVAPMVLQSDQHFRVDRFDGALRTGMLLGLALVLSLVCLSAAVVFKRFNFVAVAVLLVVIGFAVVTQGGVAGMYIDTGTARFNDQSKFITGMLFAAVLPWVVGTVVLQKIYSGVVWRLTLVWLVAALLCTLLLVGIDARKVQTLAMPLFLLGGLLFSTGIVLAAVLRKQAYAAVNLLAVMLLTFSILVPLLSVWGITDGVSSRTTSTMGFLVAALIMFYTQLLQYRYGRSVAARSSPSQGRDELTGLVHRAGFEQIFASQMQRILANKTTAAFFYIEVSNAEDLQERFGGEGFDIGMVQIAAAVSSSVSVVDTVARVAPNAFAVIMVMHKSTSAAAAVAQKIISRTMAIASHSTPIAQTSRIVIAWLPDSTNKLEDIERRALVVLQKLETGKRIGWVNPGHWAEEAQIPPHAPSSLRSDAMPESAYNEALPSLPGIINSLERQMFGADSEKPESKAQRPMRVLKNKS